MTEPGVIDRPGRELPKYWRDIATRLVQEQGWRYRYRRKGGSHPRVIPPGGALGVALPTTVTDGHAGHRASYLTALKRAGANLETDVAPEREERPVTPTDDDAAMEAIAVELGVGRSEWRERIGGDDWWRVRYQGYEAPVPEQAPDPVAAQVLSLLDKLKPKHAPKPTGVDYDDQRKAPGYSLREVRAMVRRGYPAAQVVKITGWGAYWIADLVGPDGYYLDETEDAHG